MQRRSPHPRLTQPLNLVLHQGDQGRNHHRRSRSAEGRDLVAKRFAPTGGHQHQGRATSNHMLNNLLLGPPKSAVAKNLAQHLPGRGRARRNGLWHGDFPDQTLANFIAAGAPQSPVT